MSIEIHVFENGAGSDAERKIMLDMQTASPKIAAMNLRALAAELDGPTEQRETPATAPVRERKRRSDAGQPRVTAAVSPFAAPQPE